MDAIDIKDVGVKLDSAIGATPIGWPVGSTVQLCNVPWDSEYANVVAFADADARDAYFASLSSESVKLGKLTYCFPNAPVHINKPYSSVYTYNYLVVTNPKLPTDEVAPVKYYYFIKNVVFTAPNTTSLELSLDVWTTYQFNVTLGRGFLERGHAAWHAYQNSSLSLQGRKQRYLCAPEGLDVGGSYYSNNMAVYTMGGGITDTDTEGATPWTIIVTSAVSLTTEGATKADLEKKFGTEKAPKLKMAKGMVVDGIPSGCAVYGLEADDFKEFVSNLSDYPWISTNILSITAMPEGCVIHNGNVTIAGVKGYRIKSQGTASSNPTISRPIGGLEAFMLANADNSWKRHPKSRVYPYTYLVADNLCGTPVTYKPELFNSDTVQWARMYSVVPPFQRIMLFPLYYAAGTPLSYDYSKYRIGEATAKDFTAYNGYTLNNALTWDDFPQFSILNDEYANYLASNARSIKYARDSAGWQLERSKAQAQLSYDNSMRSIGASTENQALQRQFELTRAQKTNANAYLNSLSNLAQKTSDSFGFGQTVRNYIDMAQNTIDYTTGQAQSDLGQSQFEVSKAAQTENAGANYKTALWAAKGDYQNAIAGINATCQDAQVLPPTQSGTASGGMYAVLGQLGMTNWYFQSYTVSKEYQAVIADYWNRFGYTVNEYCAIGRSFSLMTNFTYWKFQDLIVSGSSLDETSRMVVKGIFEKGVTVYDSPEKITGGVGVVDENEPKAGTPVY